MRDSCPNLTVEIICTLGDCWSKYCFHSTFSIRFMDCIMDKLVQKSTCSLESNLQTMSSRHCFHSFSSNTWSRATTCSSDKEDFETLFPPRNIVSLSTIQFYLQQMKPMCKVPWLIQITQRFCSSVVWFKTR